MNFDANPNKHFVEHFFEPVRREFPRLPIPAALDVAKERAQGSGFPVKMSVATLERVRNGR